ncbi:MAG: hypothetical protein GY777_29650 [Candidatus Brocadiaceae bacterium]|nr:hypothetical protein [Candidatus Brocadiaceae bacterium]
MTTKELVDVATIFGSFATGIGVLAAVIFGVVQASIAKRNAKANRLANQLQALVAFDGMMARYEHISAGLCPGGELYEKQKLSREELTDVERYMGLFERAKMFIDEDFLTLEVFRRLYGYRMINVASHPFIRQNKLIDRAEGWSYFLDLYKKLYPDLYKRLFPGDDLSEHAKRT